MLSAALLVAVALWAPTAAAGIRPTSFATKTAYWDQRPSAYSSPAGLFWRLEAEVELAQLQLLQVQQVSRHGTRSATTIAALAEIAAMMGLT